jgi:ABC-type branched-subunit amino acid transport system ATPase component
MDILETTALSRSFNGHTAVDALTIALEAGEVFGLLGPNGAGKTTTIKMLTTLLPPTSGTAIVAGAALSQKLGLPVEPLKAMFTHAFQITLFTCMVIASIGVFTSLMRGPRGSSETSVKLPSLPQKSTV